MWPLAARLVAAGGSWRGRRLAARADVGGFESRGVSGRHTSQGLGRGTPRRRAATPTLAQRAQRTLNEVPSMSSSSAQL
jgi:hypothetical protein